MEFIIMKIFMNLVKICQKSPRFTVHLILVWSCPGWGIIQAGAVRMGIFQWGIVLEPTGTSLETFTFVCGNDTYMLYMFIPPELKKFLHM